MKMVGEKIYGIVDDTILRLWPLVSSQANTIIHQEIYMKLSGVCPPLKENDEIFN